MTGSTRARTVWTRVGNGVPAVISWAVVVATVVGLALFPVQWIRLAAVVFAYFVVWIAVHFVFYMVGRRRCREWRLRDWIADRDVPGPDGLAPADVWHVSLWA